MGAEFDRNRMLNNINILIANKKLRKNEIEINAGASAGYLSRLAKPDNDTIPSVDLIYKIAAELGVTMDALINYDFSKASDNLLYVSAFIQELISGTDSLEIEWTKTDKRTFDTYEVLGFGFNHPLCSLDSKGNMIYNSRFLSKINLSIAGACYDANLPTSGKIYLMSVAQSTTVRFWELYIIHEYDPNDISIEDDEYDIIPICCTDGVGKELVPIINDLVECIERHEQDLKLSNRAKNAIGDFMNRGKKHETPL